MMPRQAWAASKDSEQKSVEDGEEADEEDGEADTRGGTSIIMPSHAGLWRVYIMQIPREVSWFRTGSIHFWS